MNGAIVDDPCFVFRNTARDERPHVRAAEFFPPWASIQNRTRYRRNRRLHLVTGDILPQALEHRLEHFDISA